MKQVILLCALFGLALSQTNVRGNCTREDIDVCLSRASNTLPACDTGVTPQWVAADCCYDCRPVFEEPSRCEIANIRRCEENERPTVTENGCYSCIPDNGRPNAPQCTREQFEVCRNSFADIPVCPDWAVPERTDDCCITCKEPVTGRCSEEQVNTCRNTFDSLPQCDSNTRPAFDITTCCATCRRPPPPVNFRPNADGTCSREAFLRCLVVTPVCRPGQVPERNETNQCCPSCKRPEESCTRDDVFRCIRTAPLCAANERPTYVAGECCPTCILPPPVCDCADDEICVRDGTTTGSCVPRRRLAYILRRRNGEPDNLPEEDLAPLVREIVSRYCDRNEINSRRCQRFRERFSDLLEAINARRSNENVEIDAPSRAPTRSRQVDESDFSALVGEAVGDEIAAGVYSFEESTESAASVVGLSLFALVATLLAAL